MDLAPFFGRQQVEFVHPFSSLEKRMLNDFSSMLWDRNAEDHSREFAKEVSAVANTRVDWCETPDAHIVKADVPGLNKEEIKIQLEEDRVLQISGERNKEEVKKTDKWHRVERCHGRFLRRFVLPEDLEINAITAKVDNGVLTVTIPKSKQAAQQPKSIDVK